MAENILDLPMRENDAGATTIGDYFRRIALAVWRKEDSFSGKRPFGSSAWKFDVYASLIAAGIVSGELDKEYGWVNSMPTGEEERADKLIDEALAALTSEAAS